MSNLRNVSSVFLDGVTVNFKNIVETLIVPIRDSIPSISFSYWHAISISKSSVGCISDNKPDIYSESIHLTISDFTHFISLCILLGKDFNNFVISIFNCKMNLEYLNGLWQKMKCVRNSNELELQLFYFHIFKRFYQGLKLSGIGNLRIFQNYPLHIQVILVHIRDKPQKLIDQKEKCGQVKAERGLSARIVVHLEIKHGVIDIDIYYFSFLFLIFVERRYQDMIYNEKLLHVL
ncbi:hypothetical protein FGO68_gene8049 [Halteria grandinella]|uniref:Uncharacterized protein n=1 Tax=Halteria grandinella TaxID=5974 RepID=A0A8J8NX71_HALGN|nr:hypothetical protein FGO68_gene8049 [Halteria grandinella]